MAKRKGEAIVEEYYVTTERVQSFLRYLEGESHSLGTVEKYRRDILKFQQWLEGRPVSREMVAAWRQQLTARGYAPVTVNSMLGAVNALFRFLGWEDFHAKALRVQRQIFRSEDKELSREEYQRLVTAAKSQKRWRLSLLLETICATGIRVSEVKYITVEAARQGRAEISLKGKIRTILIPGKLARKLLKYSKKQKKRLGRDLSHPKRKKHGSTTDLVRNEISLRGGKSGCQQSVSTQSAASICQSFLPGNP